MSSNFLIRASLDTNLSFTSQRSLIMFSNLESSCFSWYSSLLIIVSSTRDICSNTNERISLNCPDNHQARLQIIPPTNTPTDKPTSITSGIFSITFSSQVLYVLEEYP